jgi:hypothetical protein
MTYVSEEVQAPPLLPSDDEAESQVGYIPGLIDGDAQSDSGVVDKA